MKVSNYISQFLVKNGINQTFAVTGGGAMHLDDAIGHEEGMNIVLNHNEQASSICAEGYARVSLKPALVLVTSGPGGLNALTGVMGAYVDSIPMIIISGQVKRETIKLNYRNVNLRQLGDQEFDIINSVKNMTKFQVLVDNPTDIAYYLEKALFISMDGRKGPVWLDIPLDVQSMEIDENDLCHFTEQEKKEHKKKAFDKNIANQILNKIKTSKSPLLLAGTSVRLSNATKKFQTLIEKLKIPVVTAWNANDVVPYDNEYFVGMPGTVGTRSGNFSVQNCDLLISFGSRLNIRMIGYNHFEFAKNAYKIIIDIDNEELNKPTINPDMKINSNVSDVIDGLIEAIDSDSEYNIVYEKNNFDKWLNWCKNLFKKYPVLLPSYHDINKNINPYVFIDRLFDKLSVSDTIVTANGSCCVMTFQVAKVKQGQRLFTNSGCAAMGYGLPASIGAATYNKNNRIICLEGDGSIMMNLQELATVSYNRLNIKIIILNNNGYLSIKQTQSNLFKPPLIGVNKDSGIDFPDFRILSNAFGLEYYKMTNENECDDILEKFLKTQVPSILEVVVDENQGFSPKTSSKVLTDGTIVSSKIEDMAPFLDRDEFDSIKYI